MSVRWEPILCVVRPTPESQTGYTGVKMLTGTTGMCWPHCSSLYGANNLGSDPYTQLPTTAYQWWGWHQWGHSGAKHEAPVARQHLTQLNKAAAWGVRCLSSGNEAHSHIQGISDETCRCGTCLSKQYETIYMYILFMRIFFTHTQIAGRASMPNQGSYVQCWTACV